MWLTIAGDVFVQGASKSLVASRIDLGGRGHPADGGPGAGVSNCDRTSGAGHGGAGGIGNTGALGGNPYGDFMAPTAMGSGGGTDTCSFTAGGAGGGVMRLSVAGMVVVDGTISSDGASPGGQAGGGAGGSIWIECANLSGGGVIRANGGSGSIGWSGGGSGGRIAVDCDSSSFDAANVRAFGGNGWEPGAAGTVWLDDGVAKLPLLKFGNGGLSGAVNEIVGTLVVPGDVLVSGGARVGAENADASMHLIIDGDARVLTGASFYADGRGHPSETGPGAGQTFCDRAGGAGHGGAGGTGFSGAAGGNPYGDFAQPIEMGSGGGSDPCGSTAIGGAGGGVLRISVAGSLTVDGEISADGISAANQAGGGSGGSIRIECGELSGPGNIRANGGSGNTGFSGGGGGGRIAIMADSITMPVTSLHSRGGMGWQSAGAGTIWIDDATAPRPVLRVDNGGLTAAAITEMGGSVHIPGDVVVTGAARVGPDHEDPSLHLTIDGDVSVQDGGSFFADGRGHPSDIGPGAGQPFCDRAGGAGHGGAGGTGLSGAAGGNPYGDFAQPIEMGSGGGADTCGSTALGGAGGGVMRLSIAGSLTVDGSISADGISALNQAGGGSGGSIWIECAELSGLGVFRANGGSGNLGFSGGGGGGRISIAASEVTMPEGSFLSQGGTGWQSAGAGTIWIDDAIAPRPVLRVDNGGLVAAAITEMGGSISIPGDVIVTGAARVGPDHEDPTLHLTIDGDVTVESGASFFANGRGHSAATGPGAGITICDRAGGAGHGGAGGTGNTGAAGGNTYGDFAQPITMGSGGGTDTCGGPMGGAGGGVLRLTIGGVLAVEGTISADGASPGGEAGGGAGGSVWIECAELNGLGVVRANGGNGNTGWSGAGGGGRIAITTGQNSMSFDAIESRGGTGWQSAGAGTIWIDDATALRPVLRVDNGGLAAAAITEMGGSVNVPGDVVVTGAARLGPDHEDPTLHLTIEGDVTVDAGASFFAVGRGHASTTGPGAGLTSCDRASGAGHGGAGGNGSHGLPGGGTYGDFAQPNTMGSGGGTDTCGGPLGGAGGGVMRLTINGTLTVDGVVDGDGISPGGQAGGGAGGSIWIECAGIFGSGIIRANGGSASPSFAGAGGGGRIAIYCCAVELPAGSITSNGGVGWQSGGDGTVAYFSDSITFASLPEAVIVERGESAVFSVSAAGDGGLAYQWFFDDELLEDGLDVSGATTEMLTISNVTCLGNAGLYRVQVTDACGSSFTPNAALIVPIAGDINGDCVVNGADLAIVLGSWGPCEGCPADVFPDGVVDGADLAVVLGNWSP